MQNKKETDFLVDQQIRLAHTLTVIMGISLLVVLVISLPFGEKMR